MLGLRAFIYHSFSFLPLKIIQSALLYIRDLEGKCRTPIGTFIASDRVRGEQIFI